MYGAYSPIYGHYLRNQELLTDIAKAINGQYSAIACYERLAKLAPSDKVRNQIEEIRNDEIRHYQLFTQIYYRISGRQPTPQLSNDCPDGYEEGLHYAFKDEQETVDFYLDIADKADDSWIEKSFRRAAADEQNHAVWFLYFLTEDDDDRKAGKQ